MKNEQKKILRKKKVKENINKNAADIRLMQANEAQGDRQNSVPRQTKYRKEKSDNSIQGARQIVIQTR